MSKANYEPIIQNMTWSFSRVKAFDDCNYRWFLKYIKQYEEDDKFFSSYGTFMHKLLEQFYKGEIKKQDMLVSFLCDFSKEVRGRRPKDTIVQKYIKDGCDYLRNFEPFPFNTLAVEKRIEFDIDGIPFLGFIDYIGEKDGKLYIVDNKSRNLKPRSKRKKPTQNDLELDEMLKQLYLYSVAVEKEYGKTPDYLCFNCFRSNEFIIEDFNHLLYEETKTWVKEKILEIEKECDFFACGDFFKCAYICDVSEYCERRCDK